MRWMPLLVTVIGCGSADGIAPGTQEGSELADDRTPCDVASEQAVTDFSSPIFTLEAVDVLMAPLVGQWDVQAMLVDEEDPGGPFPGIFTVERRPGEVVARDLELSANTEFLNPSETCEDEYRIPIRLTLSLDGGHFDFPYENVLRVRPGPFAEINLWDLDGAFWVDAAPISGTMSLTDPYGAEPTHAVLYGTYVEGVWTGGVALLSHSEEAGMSREFLQF